MGGSPRKRGQLDGLAPPDMRKERLVSTDNDHKSPIHDLRDWLVGRGLPTARAEFTAQSVQAFLHHYVLSTPLAAADIGLTARPSEYGGQDAWVHMLWPDSLTIDSPVQSQQVNELHIAFTRSVAIPLLPNPSLHLQVLAPNLLTACFEDTLRAVCRHRDAAFLGILNSKVPELAGNPPS